MNAHADPRPPKPVLSIVSFSGDDLHILGCISFLDPDLAEPRQYTVEATAAVEPMTVRPAGSQAHIAGGEPYLAEATRIANALMKATFPHYSRTGLNQP